MNCHVNREAQRHKHAHGDKFFLMSQNFDVGKNEVNAEHRNEKCNNAEKSRNPSP